ncbi:glycine cleavage system aminomethyltransferase GcvT [Salipaludibacillus agaradhaerens]|uniref:glycine cleavage system aminomethyltransferase GcvT n=1 Tax=Salipaludibacillus agaradhaerens TaxID=76935 RepID=UPI002150A8DA|nr:glycine cleavage system aminomethyltransferase GcvT [Salipaludibacillus agaradhaerens]MCR6106401.1 glycine cleavage system aminomethyltransferase GcvT [Salipaludibacillus agaradhaerens]MCR6118434.1 glycine cleavage system aminomethyltransferase GcvT [Salipaludibacillus agaradhaerens]
MSGKRTPLFTTYEKKAKVINFGGWELPVQFSSIQEEHAAVREKAGLFDVSHMGEIEIKGPGTLNFLQHILTNDVEKLKVGSCQYTAMCYENGGTVDDLVLYKKSDEDVLLVVNAANIEKDVNWLKQHVFGDVQIFNASDQYAQLAIQGPKAEEITQQLTNESLNQITFFKFRDEVELAGKLVLISRTGYTGEDGFEIYCRPEDAVLLWERLIESGTAFGILPCGLGARDTLRFEAKLALYGQELSDTISPIEAGIGFAVKTEKETNFIGKDVLKRQREQGVTRKLVGLEMIEKGIPRSQYEVYKNDEKIGFVTTGTQSPTLKKNIGLALIDATYKDLDTEVEVQIRKRRAKAKIVKTPFYHR